MRENDRLTPFVSRVIRTLGPSHTSAEYQEEVRNHNGATLARSPRLIKASTLDSIGVMKNRVVLPLAAPDNGSDGIVGVFSGASGYEPNVLVFAGTIATFTPCLEHVLMLILSTQGFTSRLSICEKCWRRRIVTYFTSVSAYCSVSCQ